MTEELTAALEKAAVVLREGLEKQAQNPLQSILGKLTPVQQASIRNALIGALVGGAGGGGLAAAADKPVLGTALAGAGLGALAGGGGTYGLGLLSGQERFPGEPASPESLLGRGTEALVSAPLRHPLMTLGGILGGVGAAKTTPTAANLLTQLKALVLEKGSPLAAEARRGTQALSRIMTEPSLLSRVGAALPTGGKGLVSRLLTALRPGTRVGRMLKAWPKGLPRPRGRAGLALLPAGIGIGWLLDKYLKGEY